MFHHTPQDAFLTEATDLPAETITTAEDEEGEGDSGAKDNDFTRVQLLIIAVVALLMWTNVLVVTTNARLTPSPSRLYMSALAVSDLIICINYIIYRLALVGIYGDQLPKAFYQIMNLFLTWSLIYSILLLQVIAVDRYFAVCRPTSTFLRLERVKKVLVALVFVAASLVAAEKLLAGFYREDVGNYFASMVWAFATVVLVIMYTRIGIGLFTRARAKRRVHADGRPSNPTSTSTKLTHLVKQSNCPEASGTSKEMVSLQVLASGSTPMPRSSAASDRLGSTSAASSSSAPNPSRVVTASKQDHQMTRTGLMLTVVTVMFFVCWAPFWLFFAFGVNVPAVVRDLYIANSLVNPLIYWCLSKSFRERVLKSLTCGRFII